MVDLDVSVLVAEENATRADLYDHWLVGFEVRKALTTRQAVEAFDDDVAVVLLDEEFGDGSATDLIEWIEANSRFCQIVTTTPDRGQVFPDHDVAEHLVKPVFKEDLRSVVKRLGRQTVYAALLARYYATTVQITSLREGDGETVDDDVVTSLEDRVERLKAAIVQLRGTLDEDDMRRVMDLVSPPADPTIPESGQSSKYMPEKCSKCGRPWGGDESTGVLRLGAGVYRCADCGTVQFVSAAGNPRLRHPH